MNAWKSKESMSNTSYHAAGKPSWWARVGSNFLDIPKQRGDSTLEIERALWDGLRQATEDVVVEYGVGKIGEKGAIRGKIKLASLAEKADAKGVK